METAAEFVEGFRRYWSAPSLDGLSALLAPDVTLVQPLAPRMRGLDEVRRQFGAIFAWLPDLRAEVDRWSSAGNVVFIEFRLRATIGGRPFEWPVVDRFLLRDDGASRRPRAVGQDDRRPRGEGDGLLLRVDELRVRHGEGPPPMHHPPPRHDVLPVGPDRAHEVHLEIER